MNMTWLDWSIVLGLVGFVAYVANGTKKYNRSVADFLAAGRCAGKYLLATSQGTAAIGAASVIAIFEIYTRAGFTYGFWYLICMPINLFIYLSGFVIYRYRATRALTLAQFFEARYSKKFRIFAGSLAWLAGIINFGILPATGARFFINFCGFTNYYWQLGPIEVNLTLAVAMLILIGSAVYFTFVGGQISVLVTDFWQGLFAGFVFLAIVIFIFWTFSWDKIQESLVIASTPGKSLIDPFDIADKQDFDFTFFAIVAFFVFYSTMAWQGQQAYNCSARTPHESKMANVVGSLRSMILGVGLLLIPLAALVLMNHPDYASEASKITNTLVQTFPRKETLQVQMMVPVAMAQFLPAGFIGAFAAAMLGFFISTTNSYMHSWGSIFVQDIVCPLRKKELSPELHIRYLRISIVFVGIFGFFFGLFFPLKEYLQMFFMITSIIFVGGAGSVIIGGLYWKRGTTAAAWTAMIVGAVLSIATIVTRSTWQHIPFLAERWGDNFPFNSQVMSFWCAAAAAISYVAVSLLGKRSVTNMDRLLHRGKYAVEEEKKEFEACGAEPKPISRYWKLIGVNSHEFSKVDKGLYLYTFIYMTYNFIAFIVMVILSWMGLMTIQRWFGWWRYGYVLPMFAIGVISIVWISIGGLFDLSKMYKRLATAKRNALDDGRVSGDHNLADERNSG